MRQSSPLPRVLLVILAIALPGAALAQSRASIRNLTCAQAQRIVSSQGAVVLDTGPFTFDRYVAHTGFCERDQTTTPVWEAARDNPQCPVGYRCIDLSGGRVNTNSR